MFYVFFQKFFVDSNVVEEALLTGNPHNAMRVAYQITVDNKEIEAGKLMSS